METDDCKVKFVREQRRLFTIETTLICYHVTLWMVMQYT